MEAEPPRTAVAASTWGSVDRRSAPSTCEELQTLLDLCRPCLLEGGGLCAALGNAARELCTALETSKVPVRVYSRPGAFTYAVEELTLPELCATLAEETALAATARHYLAGPNMLLHDDEAVRLKVHTMLFVCWLLAELLLSLHKHANSRKPWAGACRFLPSTFRRLVCGPVAMLSALRQGA